MGQQGTSTVSHALPPTLNVHPFLIDHGRVSCTVQEILLIGWPEPMHVYLARYLSQISYYSGEVRCKQDCCMAVVLFQGFWSVVAFSPSRGIHVHGIVRHRKRARCFCCHSHFVPSLMSQSYHNLVLGPATFLRPQRT